jgi:hypothetical protein
MSRWDFVDVDCERDGSTGLSLMISSCSSSVRVNGLDWLSYKDDIKLRLLAVAAGFIFQSLRSRTRFDLVSWLRLFVGS